MSVRKIFLFFVFVLAFCLEAQTQNDSIPVSSTVSTVRAKVLQVYTGDSIQVLINGSKRNVHFASIDAPEFSSKVSTRTQPFATESRDSLRQILFERDSTVLLNLNPFVLDNGYYVDPYLEDSNGEILLLSNYLLSAGFVVFYNGLIDRHDLALRDDMILIEQESKLRRLGLWSNNIVYSPCYWKEKF